MVRRYVKGARAERELGRKLEEMGFAIIRAAGSGGAISTPDLVAIKKGRVLAFECKAWKTTPHLKKQEYENFKKWCQMSGAMGFMAWKNRGWKFLSVKDIGEKNIRKDGINFKDLVFIINV
jgi:Holliday junction resolvase